MEIEITNEMMCDLVNFSFKSFNNGLIELPIEIKQNKNFLKEVRLGKIPTIKFSSKNSFNQIEFYVVTVNSKEKMKFEDIRLKTNYYTLFDDKYKFN